MIRYFKWKKRCFYLQMANAVILLILGFSTYAFSADVQDVSKNQSARLVHKETSSRADDPFDDIYFPTIYKSGFDACANTDGQPVIFLFSSASCFHCEWLKEIFEPIAEHYMEKGLIEAHLYDKVSGDDLFTEEIETEIPEAFLEIYNRGNPKNRVPYVNFSCKYERVGNGYEETQDTDAEGQEMIDVIETLIRVLSEGNGDAH